MERSFSLPSRPSQTMRPTRTTSACAGKPMRPSTTASNSGWRARTASSKSASASVTRASRYAAWSSKDSSIHAYAPCRGPVQRALSPSTCTATRSVRAAPASAAAGPLAMAIVSFTEDFTEICQRFLCISGVTGSLNSASPRASFKRFGSGVTASAGFGAMPRAAPTPLGREAEGVVFGRFMKGNVLWLIFDLPGVRLAAVEFFSISFCK
mmetsp:Transcript_18414/g.52844  ORF Transcript_18414/g.52844 Transcript_18414/m.52844 type:complete len:210 (+) Transcript_18414:1285-1914(+)